MNGLQISNLLVNDLVADCGYEGDDESLNKYIAK